MWHRISVLYIFLLICILPLYSQDITDSTLIKTPSLTVQIDSLLAPLLQKGASIGIDIRSLSTDSTLYARNPKSYMTPASLQKLFTTSVCLNTKGADYQFHTPVMYTGKMKKRHISGDLVVCGAGDPSMSDRYFKGDAKVIFEAWADSLLARNIQKIKGDIVILDTLFRVNSWGSGWDWDDLAYDYAPVRSSFIFNENRGFMTIINAGGNPPVVIMEEENEELPIQNEIKSDANINRTSLQIIPLLDRGGLKLTGVIKPNTIDDEYFALPNPDLTAGKILQGILKRKGIKCKGKVRVVHSLPELKDQRLHPIFEHISPDLAKIIRLTNKYSVNIAAEALLLQLGRTDKNSISFLKNALQPMNIEPDSIFIADGSGLSRYNLLTAEQCSNLLRAMSERPQFIPFLTSLPIAGKDGSLVNRMKETPALGMVFAKTGSMRYVRNLCGYAMNRNGSLIAVTILMNDYPNDKEMVAIQDAICSLLVETDF